MDEKTLIESAVKSANSLILTAKKLEEGKFTPTKGNAITNAYRSAGQLYLSILQSTRDVANINVAGNTEVTLSKADCKRLDAIAKLLGSQEEPDVKGKESKGYRG